MSNSSSLNGKPDDDESRKSWTVKDWYTHVGAWENDKGQLCFGSTMAFSAMLTHFHRVHTTPAAQAVDEDGERAAFERAFPGKDYTRCSHEDYAGTYEDFDLQRAFYGWLARAALAAPAQEPVVWGAPKTVRQLISQLQTLDPDLETVALYRLPDGLGELSGKIKQGHISISYERMDGIWLGPYKGSGRKVLAFWTKLDPREVPDGEPLTPPQD